MILFLDSFRSVETPLMEMSAANLVKENSSLSEAEARQLAKEEERRMRAEKRRLARLEEHFFVSQLSTC